MTALKCVANVGDCSGKARSSLGCLQVQVPPAASWTMLSRDQNYNSRRALRRGLARVAWQTLRRLA